MEMECQFTSIYGEFVTSQTASFTFHAQIYYIQVPVIAVFFKELGE